MQRSIVRSLLVASASFCGVAAPAAFAATDAAQVLQLAQDALRSLRSATYEADYFGVGRFAIWPVMSGRVILSKLEPGNSMRAKLAVQGVQVRPGKVEPAPFHVAFDGVTSRWVQHSSVASGPRGIVPSRHGKGHRLGAR